MTLRFDGEGCGLGFKSESGDRNDPLNYMLECGTCKVELGPLARFPKDPSTGNRTALCMLCDSIWLVRDGTDVKYVMKGEEWEAIKKNKRAIEAGAKL